MSRQRISSVQFKGKVVIDSGLKIGQFTFSEQDLVIPVNGIPLTVVRTYNSFNTVEGDFGFNWNTENAFSRWAAGGHSSAIRHPKSFQSLFGY